MRPVATRFALAGLLACAFHSTPLAADVLILKNGDKIEGDVAEKGDTYDVKTKYGVQTVPKSDVKKIIKSARQMTDEADTLLKKARGIFDDAVQNETNPEERNRKLNVAIGQLDSALKIYNEAREIFPGPECSYIEEGIKAAIQESRKCRYKLTREEDLHKPPEPPKSEAKKDDATPPAGSADPKVAEPAKEALKKDPAASEPLTFEQPVKPPTRKGEPGNAPPASDPASVGDGGKPDRAIAKAPPPKPAPKTPQEYLADLASPEAKLRLAAVQHFAESPAPEALAPLADLLKKEEAAEVLKASAAALGGYDGALLAKQAVLKDVALNGSDPQKRALITALKKAGSEAGVRFLVEQFVARGESTLRNNVASALKKHKKLAMKPLKEFFGKAAGRPDIQIDIIKYIGIIGESKQGATFLISLIEVKEVINVVLNALRKVDKPVIPALIQVGLPGPSRTRMWSGWLLRGLTNQAFSSQNSAEWTKWWSLNRKGVEAEEAKWDKADEASDWAVDELDWAEYDVEIANNYYGTYWWWPWRYESARGRPRGPGVRVIWRGAGGVQVGGAQQDANAGTDGNNR